MTVSEIQLILKMMTRMFNKHPAFWFIEMCVLFIIGVGVLVLFGEHPQNGVAMITAGIIYHGVLVGNTMIILARIGASKVIPQVDPRWHLMKPDYDRTKELEEDTEMTLEHGEVLDNRDYAANPRNLIS